MNTDILNARSSNVPAKYQVNGEWLSWSGQLALRLGWLGAEALAVLAGSQAARVIAPSLIGDKIVYAVLALYLFICVVTFATRSLTGKTAIRSTWLPWLALLLGMTMTSSRGIRDIEAIAAWFVVVCVGSMVIDLAVKRLQEGLARVLPRTRTVAFLGNSQSAAMMLSQLRQDRQSNVQVIGFFDDRLNRPGPLTGLVPCLGTIDDLVGYIHDAELSEVYMALPWSAGPRISHLIERLRFLPLTVRLVPDHVPPALPGRGDGQLYGVVMPTLMMPPFSAANAVFKRLIDIAAAAVLLIPLIPLFIVVAICLKIDSRGPVFFRQTRSGQFGRPFQIFKFRSLHVAQADTAAETLVTAGDRRVTRVGHIIRKYSIDELPQIFNVLLGQMSLVGPRPHAPRAKADGRIYAEVMPEYMLRYRVKPGMTGWAQVNGWRGNTDTEEQLRKRVEYDFQYIGKWSLWKDLQIIFRTVPAMLLPPTQNV